ncbi:DUF4442 domain-containing protein [Aeromonas sp. RU39B]|jgi:acyl-coenzyme A thioesterase PaaI-like protein|uniref:DUF4442 domain-containing protein n=1 Tax=Aeromonas sp. RU39B TaxID=1907416 RepID=UPI000970DCF4|nr:DUF4442 domain-containing protein [Aeromonas sp. RU39B]
MEWFFKRASRIRMALNWWPPFRGAGIRIDTLSEDFRYCKVVLTSRWGTLNANRTQFGGSMFAMTDPIYPLMLMGYFKNHYYVWDKSGDIDYIKPGKGPLVAEFHLTDSKLAEIEAATGEGEKHFPEFTVAILDGKGEVVANVRRTLYVRKRREHR